MARPLANVLSLFPHALAVFASALALMIAAAFAMALRARQIGGRFLLLHPRPNSTRIISTP